MAPGSSVKLEVVQKGKERTVNLTLGELPNQREARASLDDDRGQRSQRGMELGRLGMSVAPANSVAGAGKEGVVVTEVQPSGAAAERGFKEGDVILEVGGKAVSSVGDVRDAIQSARAENKNTVLIRVKTGGSSRFVAVPLGRG
jgi:serine protease Do